jgi:arylsulfatase A-like enzyme
VSERKPNVLVVIADEWRAQALGYAGDANAQTPAIDRFAMQSLNFEQAIAGAPVCCPARASFITGQYPLTHGVYINDVPLEPTGTTLGEAFKEAGYRTAYIGKWHLYGSPDGNYGRRESWIPPEKHFGFEYWKAGECTHDYNHSFYYEGDDPTKKYWDGYDAIAQTEDARRFIRENAQEEQPYLLVISYGPPHFPLETAPDRYREQYRDREIRLRPNVPPEAAVHAREALRGYYAHIAALDDCFSGLLTTLAETGTADDTVVVFTSDHGDMMGSQGMEAEQKLYPWEEAVRVPLLVRYPARLGAEGQRSPALINSPDLMPSLLGLCGIAIPDGVQGTDYFGNKGRLPTSSAYVSMPVPILVARAHGISEYRGVRDARYTYVRTITGPWLLYDNQQDPYQMRNRCGDPALEEVQAGMEAELQRWLAALGDEFLPANEYLRRDGLTHYFEATSPVGHSRSPWGDWKSTMAPDAQTSGRG